MVGILIFLAILVILFILFIRFLGRVSSPDIQLTGDYRLEYFNGDMGEGFNVVRKDGQRLSWRTLPRSEGLESINVVGESRRKKQLRDPAFDAGRRVALVPEPDNPHDPNAIGVWDAERRLQAGYIPADEAKRIGKKLEAGEVDRAIVMWESEKNGKRVGIRLLLLGQGASVLQP